ncbi:glutathione S-transferase zeta class-like [Actinidia eriantha]|uniref:glutathione S-transferase zeta class-like n=1 Tax=Actinidia eriantha TaxID=165200 RepID=UPI00258C7F7A|nr:glutathione S-transferase zeta class-like [Actinidia eriantha]
MANKGVVDLNVLGSFMKDIIVSNLNNTVAANIVSSSVQPLQNIAVQSVMGIVFLVSIYRSILRKKLILTRNLLGLSTILGKGFAALEKLLKDYAKKYATGDEVHLADLFLAPQIHAEIKRLNEAYNEPPAFLDAMPEQQSDTPVEALA